MKAIKAIIRDFISFEKRDFKFKMGDLLASALAGFVAGTIAAIIVYLVCYFVFFS